MRKRRESARRQAQRKALNLIKQQRYQSASIRPKLSKVEEESIQLNSDQSNTASVSELNNPPYSENRQYSSNNALNAQNTS